MARRVKLPDCDISTPKDPGWKNMTHPAKELTNKQLFMMLQKKRKPK